MVLGYLRRRYKNFGLRQAILFATAKNKREFHRDQYLWSPRWRLIVQPMRRAIDGNRCKNCGSRGPLDVHHLSYRYAGKSLLDFSSILGEVIDCRTLCRSCHQKEH